MMWLQLSIALVASYARAQGPLSADTKQRLVDIFGVPTYDDGVDLTGNDVIPGNGTDCICVAYSRCRVTNESFYENIDLEVRHMSCPNVFDWCCERGHVRAAAPTVREGCGWAGDERGEGVAAFGEFPWVVAILHKSAGKTWSPSEYVGGGSIIHPSVVLTAAHKMAGQDHTKLKCRAGEWNSSSASEPLPHHDRSIGRVIKHEGYYRRLLSNNIALILLSTPFDLAHYSHIGAACVRPTLPTPGTTCFATGWGKEKHGPQGRYRTVLKKVEVPLVDRYECERTLRATRLGRRFELHASELCAGRAGADACTGDGGAPLVCPVSIQNSDRYAVVGMSAWGMGCGTLPGVYVSVPNFYDWIGDVMKAQPYNTASYEYDTHMKWRIAQWTAGESGECVHFYQCRSDDSANTDGGGSIDLRSGFTPCSSYLDVSAGPLTASPTKWEDRYVQHGIVAWGIGCGGEAPGVYVDVGSLRAWVDGEVTRHGYSPSVYSLD